ncbi:hypothetical protein SeMB42_g05023 [Synchytrium endobioticum]|uniref:Uncharacterized protein n=1 Tax=Synchytrium endobioticum TaxID=286115 RepID=A0A507CUI8_9FUNG|nr:hypothetical protein SeMB42_g05023 [Synchytrium endobioticum]
MAAAAPVAPDLTSQTATAKAVSQVTLQDTTSGEVPPPPPTQHQQMPSNELTLHLSRQYVVYGDSIIFRINREGLSRTHLYITDRSGLEIFKLKVSPGLGLLRKSYSVLARVDGVFLHRASVSWTKQCQYLIEADPWHSVTMNFTNTASVTINTTTTPTTEIGVLKLASALPVDASSLGQNVEPNISNIESGNNGSPTTMRRERRRSVFNPHGDLHEYDLVLHPSYRSKLGALHLDVLIASMIAVLDSESHGARLSQAFAKLPGGRGLAGTTRPRHGNAVDIHGPVSWLLGIALTTQDIAQVLQSILNGPLTSPDHHLMICIFIKSTTSLSCDNQTHRWLLRKYVGIEIVSLDNLTSSANFVIQCCFAPVKSISHRLRGGEFNNMLVTFTSFTSSENRPALQCCHNYSRATLKQTLGYLHYTSMRRRDSQYDHHDHYRKNVQNVASGFANSQMKAVAPG